jgi:DNA-binding response OmpR family regulator
VLGAAASIAKPFDLAELLGTVRRLLTEHPRATQS